MSEQPGTSTSAPEKPGRYQRSAAGMVGAMLVLLLVVAAYVGFRALTRDDLVVNPERVDYLAVVAATQQSGVDVVYPASLPDGWLPTGAEIVPGDELDWSIRTLTSDGEFAGVTESTRDIDDLIAQHVDEHAEEQDSIAADLAWAPTWRQWTDAGGDTAYAAPVTPGLGGSEPSWVLVFGSATPEQLQDLLGRLTLDPVPAG